MTQALRAPGKAEEATAVEISGGQKFSYGGGVLILDTLTGRPPTLAEGEWDRLVELGAEVVDMGDLDNLTSHPR